MPQNNASKQRELLAEDATPETCAAQHEAPTPRKRHLQEGEDVALRKIEHAAGYVRAHSTRHGVIRRDHGEDPARANP